MKKKILLGALIATATLSLVGCGKKEEKKEETKPVEQKEESKLLICSMTEDEEEYVKTVKYTLTYDGNAYSKAIASVQNKYESESTAKKEYEKVAEDVKKVNTNKGVSANVQTSGTSVYLTYSFVIKDLDDEAKKSYEETGLKELDGKSYDEVKSLLESISFKCN
ncbi:MAG: hypothetical protein IJ572_04100 [Bacilli bacterium]|nr:hypothetical protein [Bacilli bacterium]